MNNSSLWLGFITYGETTARYLPSFLDSLKGSNATIVAFDNTPRSEIGDSNPNPKILARYPDIRLMGDGENYGFGAAYNKMIAAAIATGAEYFLIINPDTVVKAGAIEKMLCALENDSKLGSVAPKLRRFDFEHSTKTEILDSAGLILRSGLRFIDLGQGEIDNGQYNNAAVIGASGAAGLFRLNALEKIKENNQYFDEHFFMYKEDCDLAYRLHLAGFSSRLVSKAVIYHDRSASGGSLYGRLENRRRSRQINIWSFTNQHYLWLKYWGQESFFGKLIICCRVLVRFFAALIFEPYLLGCYKTISQARKSLKKY